MKKTLALIAFLSVAAMTLAQQPVMTATGGFGALSANYTLDGKGRLLSASYNQQDDRLTDLTIYDATLQVEKCIKPALETLHYRTELKKAVVGKVDNYVTANYQISNSTSIGDIANDYGINVTDVQTLALYLNMSTGVDLSVIRTFTDKRGLPSAMFGYNPDFYFMHWEFGENFPREYFSLNGDYVEQVYVDYQEEMWRMFEETDFDNLTWQPVPNSENDWEINTEVIPLCLTNIDKGEGSENSDAMTWVSQNLFNNDEKWEYLVTGYDPAVPKQSLPARDMIEQIGCEDDNLVVYVRMPSANSEETNCIKIMNEDGTVLATWMNQNLIRGHSAEEEIYAFVLGGNLLIQAEVHDYENNGYNYELLMYNKQDNSLTTVATGKLCVRPNVVRRGESATIRFDSPTEATTLSLTDALGRQLGERLVNDGMQSADIATDNLSAGVYHLTVKQHGKVSGTERIIVK